MTTTLHRAALAAPILAAALLLGGCFTLNDVFPNEVVSRDEETDEITDGGDLDIFTLKVGDCVATTVSEEQVSEIPVVPCDEPHDTEVYFEFALADGEYPGEDAIYAEADERCLAEFETFVDLPYEESGLEFSYYFPTQGSWEELDDRLVQCLILDPEGRVTGSLEGAAR